LELVDGVAELICATEFADDFIDVTVIGNGPDFQHVGRRELKFAVGGIFLQQVVQDFAGFWAEVIEERVLLPLHAVGALAACEHGGVKGEMAQQAERVGVWFPPRRLKSWNYVVPACVRHVHRRLRAINSIEKPLSGNIKTDTWPQAALCGQNFAAHSDEN